VAGCCEDGGKQVPYKAGNYLTSWTTVSFSRGTVFVYQFNWVAVSLKMCPCSLMLISFAS
jgi:hypothetical protein